MSQVFYKVLIMETIPTCHIRVPYKVSTWMSNTQARPLCCTFNESESVSCSVVSSSLQPHGLKPARLLCPWDSPGKNTGVGCRSLLQGIFSTQGSHPGLLHCRGLFTAWATKEGLTNHAMTASTCVPNTRLIEACISACFNPIWRKQEGITNEVIFEMAWGMRRSS